MKPLKYIFALAFMVLLTSCSSVRVTSDYDTHTDFSAYKTFAFYKTGIDKAEISDLEKRRILRSIERHLLAKDMTKSETPDILVSIFTKAREQVNIYEPHWTPFYYNPYDRTRVSKYTEGTLFIDLIDAKGKKLIWQGVGTGYLTKSHKPEKRVENIDKFVNEILSEYPPEKR